jgi:hypothetical protein
VPTEADDPSAGYEMVDIEIIDRGPRTGYAYQLDNRKVWKIMKSICGRNTCYIYINGAAKAKDEGKHFICSVIITLALLVTSATLTSRSMFGFTPTAFCLEWSDGAWLLRDR